MTPAHHPTDDVLTRYAAATLGEGATLVIGAHLAVCGVCHDLVEIGETIGGTLLESLEPMAMAPDAYAAALRRIDMTPDPRTIVRAPRAEIEPGLPLPEALRGHAMGKWRFLAPGLRFSRISPAPDGPAKVFLLRAAPGSYLPEHGHHGEEFICVLKGAFSDDNGHYVPGDIAAADDATLHAPRVDIGGECICLVALEGNLKLRSLVGRLLQPVCGL